MKAEFRSVCNANCKCLQKQVLAATFRSKRRPPPLELSPDPHWRAKLRAAAHVPPTNLFWLGRIGRSFLRRQHVDQSVLQLVLPRVPSENSVDLCICPTSWAVMTHKKEPCEAWAGVSRRTASCHVQRTDCGNGFANFGCHTRAQAKLRTHCDRTRSKATNTPLRVADCIFRFQTAAPLPEQGLQMSRRCLS